MTLGGTSDRICGLPPLCLIGILWRCATPTPMCWASSSDKPDPARQREPWGLLAGWAHLRDVPGPRYWDTNESKPHWAQIGHNPGAASADRFIRFVTELATGDRHSLRDDLRRILDGAEAHRQLDNWPNFCKVMREQFEGALEEWHRDYEAFRHMWLETSADSSDLETTRRVANFAYYQIKELCDRNVIEELANHRFLPRFGFPIGVLQLRVDDDRTSRSRRRRVQPWRLQRAGLIGLREYAPGCTVLAGGWRIMSRGPRQALERK